MDAANHRRACLAAMGVTAWVPRAASAGEDLDAPAAPAPTAGVSTEPAPDWDSLAATVERSSWSHRQSSSSWPLPASWSDCG